jgi:hypothetical protein
MSGIYFLLFLVGFVLIVYWARRNDAIPPKERTVGLLRTSLGVAKEKAGADEETPTGVARFRSRRTRR